MKFGLFGRLAFVLAVLLLAGTYLVPALVFFTPPGSAEKPENAFVEEYFPKTRLNLGLDLLGGIHLTLGVEVDRAIETSLTQHGNAITMDARKQNILMTKPRLLPTGSLELTLADATKQDDFEELIAKTYPGLSLSSPAKSGAGYLVYTALYTETEKKAIAEMEETVRQAQADRDENKLLRDLLDLRAQRRDLSDFEAAAITEHSVTNWASSLTLNKGTAHGVEAGDSVIDATGALVGVIDEAGHNWSTVLTTVDTDTSLGARVFRTKDLGLAQGDFSLMGKNLLRLDYLPSDCELLSGDLVETSGLGGFFPSGLVIGYVREVQLDDSGAASYAIVAPAVDFDELTEVFVIKSFDIVT